MEKRLSALAVVLVALGLLAGCGNTKDMGESLSSSVVTVPDSLAEENPQEKESAGRTEAGEAVTAGTETYRQFVLDNVLHSDSEGDIHYNLYVPEDDDTDTPYALFVTLPGYEGLYFQGVGVNLRSEDFAFEALKYKDHMIVAAPQLEDWGETSARKTIALTEYLLEQYPIDRNQVYINGYSGGGETLSLVLDENPGLYTAALMCSSRWDGGYENVTRARTPVYFVIGESDEYYGAEPFRSAYEEIRSRYAAEGLSDADIAELITLDVKPASYFTNGGVSNQHGGGGTLFCRDTRIMNWLFGDH